MTGRQKSLDLVIRIAQDGMHGRWNQHVCWENAEIADIVAFRVQQAGCNGRGGGLKSDGKKHHLFVGCILRQFHCV